jgi:hypothetical protein
VFYYHVFATFDLYFTIVGHHHSAIVHDSRCIVHTAIELVAVVVGDTHFARPEVEPKQKAYDQ